MTTRKQVLVQIEKMGCTLDELGSDSEHLVIDAPKGKIFACNAGTHCLVEWLVDEFNPNLTRSDAYREIMNDLSYGLEPCEDPECDICHPE